MTIPPAEGGLDNPVQLAEMEAPRDHELAPDRRLGVEHGGKMIGKRRLAARGMAARSTGRHRRGRSCAARAVHPAPPRRGGRPGAETARRGTPNDGRLAASWSARR